jgi:hypothetical protein
LSAVEGQVSSVRRVVVAALAALVSVGASSPVRAAESPPAGPPPKAKPFSLLAPLSETALSPPENEYRLRRATDGSGDFLYEAAGFAARVHRDGSVSFSDKRLEHSFVPPFLPKPGPARGATLQSPQGPVTFSALPTPTDRPPRDDGARPSDDRSLIIPNVTPFRPDPREGCRYPSPCFFAADLVLLNVTGSFDLTDELFRFHRKDRHRFEKARFMTGTRELRINLASRAQAEDLARASDQLPAQLKSIADNERLTLGERRAILQGLAAEVDVTTAGGKAIRARIEAFIRSRFAAPDGGS